MTFIDAAAVVVVVLVYYYLTKIAIFELNSTNFHLNGPYK